MSNDDYGAPMNYTFYIGGEARTFQFRPWEPLSNVREELTAKGLMTENYAFIYENSATKLKTIFTPQSRENQFYLGTAQPHSQAGAAFPSIPSEGINNPIVQIVSIDENRPSFLGTTPEDGWLRNNTIMGVRIRLNNSDATAVQNNQGMFQPVLLNNVQSANPNAPVSFEYVCITQKGAIISLDVSSWGAAGYGYAVTTAMGTSINPNGLYNTYSGNYGHQSYLTLSRYTGGEYGDTIQMQSNASMNISTQYNIQYSTLVFKTWSLSSWTDSNGTKYSSNLSIPLGNPHAGFKFEPGPPSGTVSIPRSTVSSGSPSAGPQSQQTFGTFSSCEPLGIPKTRSEGLVGSLQIYFFVFNSKQEAKTVIRVLNRNSLNLFD
ncbi:MAG: hypothetical protein GDA56_20670 [Hormoscilla sp. GM7CHS1pb]|nr:hypothetical protein [Hormoscilla sp. GM7CHS1pb]